MKRAFSRGYKLSVVKEVLRGEKAVAQICREQNLGQNVVRRWKREYEEQGDAAWQASPPEGSVVWTGPATTAGPYIDSADDKRLLQQQMRIAALEAALGRSHLENEFLREALSKKGSALPRR